MADRIGAALFGEFFEMLAENPTEEHKKMAKKIWSMKDCHDFNNYQMYCDDALIKLDLATIDNDKNVFYLNKFGTSYE